MDRHIRMRKATPVKKKRTLLPKVPLPAKLTRPRANALLSRERIFRQLDAADGVRWTWVSAPAGAGKTSLGSSWIESKRCACLWYQLDAGDAARVRHARNAAIAAPVDARFGVLRQRV